MGGVWVLIVFIVSNISAVYEWLAIIDIEDISLTRDVGYYTKKAGREAAIVFKEQLNAC